MSTKAGSKLITFLYFLALDELAWGTIEDGIKTAIERPDNFVPSIGNIVLVRTAERWARELGEKNQSEAEIENQNTEFHRRGHEIERLQAKLGRQTETIERLRDERDTLVKLGNRGVSDESQNDYEYLVELKKNNAAEIGKLVQELCGKDDEILRLKQVDQHQGCKIAEIQSQLRTRGEAIKNRNAKIERLESGQGVLEQEIDRYAVAIAKERRDIKRLSGLLVDEANLNKQLNGEPYDTIRDLSSRINTVNINYETLATISEQYYQLISAQHNAMNQALVTLKKLRFGSAEAPIDEDGAFCMVKGAIDALVDAVRLKPVEVKPFDGKASTVEANEIRAHAGEMPVFIKRAKPDPDEGVYICFGCGQNFSKNKVSEILVPDPAGDLTVCFCDPCFKSVKPNPLEYAAAKIEGKSIVCPRCEQFHMPGQCPLDQPKTRKGAAHA